MDKFYNAVATSHQSIAYTASRSTHAPSDVQQVPPSTAKQNASFTQGSDAQKFRKINNRIHNQHN